VSLKYYGVYGVTTNNGTGVVGAAATIDGTGVLGTATNSVGVRGVSTISGVGVAGQSSTGVRGYAFN
jgi:hypothetical protein